MDPAAESLSGELAKRGLSIDEVARQLRARPDLPADAPVFAYGSLVEGLGNDHSDLDLCLLTDEPKTGISPQDSTSFAIGGLQCDLAFVSRAALAEATKRLRELNGKPRDVRAAALRLGFHQRKMLHALLNGVPILGSEPAPADLRGEELARNAIARARYWVGNRQVDLAGMRRRGEWGSMLFVAQELLLQTVDALLASFGVTNPGTKWRVKLLERLPLGWDAFLPPDERRPTAAELIFELHRAPPVVDAEGVLRHAMRILSFSRRVFLWAEGRWLDSRVPGDAAHSGAAGSGSGATPAALDLGIAVLLDGADAVLLRLSDSAAIEFARPLLPFILLADGRASETLLSGLARAGEGPVAAAAFEALIGRCRDSGFLLSDPAQESVIASLLAPPGGAGRR